MADNIYRVACMRVPKDKRCKAVVTQWVVVADSPEAALVLVGDEEPMGWRSEHEQWVVTQHDPKECPVIVHGIHGSPRLFDSLDGTYYTRDSRVVFRPLR